jgi:RNA polymerase subunit RPABC4/transcription elongation factor Spt4
MSRAVKVKSLDGKILVKKDEKALLRGVVVVLNPEESEIAKNLEIKEKGVYGMKFK